VSGLLYLYYNELPHRRFAGLPALNLGSIALMHTAAAFMMLAFLIGPPLLVHTGHTRSPRSRRLTPAGRWEADAGTLVKESSQ